MYASGLSSHRIRIKKIKAKKAHLGCLQRKRFQRHPLLFCSHLMPDSIANHIRFTFKTSPKSSHCPPPPSQPVLPRLSAHKNHCHGCLCTWLSPLCPCRWLLGKNNLIWMYPRSHCCSQNPLWLPIPLWFKATVLTTGSRSCLLKRWLIPSLNTFFLFSPAHDGLLTSRPLH